jgi:hypothetical protein
MPIDDSESPLSEPPVDLRGLRPDPARLEALALRIEAAAAPALARRAVTEDVQRTLARAAWPALVAAAAALVAAVGLGRAAGASAEESLATTGVERIVPAASVQASWIVDQSAPSDADLAQAIGLGGSQ